MGITFVGFNVNEKGDLLDPAKDPKEVIEQAVMQSNLYDALQLNKVDLSENYRRWTRVTMLEKLQMVMGVEWLQDPDHSYVLTVDNLIKMLAIQMRFRCM